MSGSDSLIDRRQEALVHVRALREKLDKFLSEFDETEKNRRGNGRLPTAVEVRAILRARNLRKGFVGSQFWRDIPWDMLLELYAARLSESQVSVSSVCVISTAPLTTALRWLGLLESAGMIARTRDKRDGRRSFLSLTDHGVARMDHYFKALPDFGGL